MYIIRKRKFDDIMDNKSIFYKYFVVNNIGIKIV